MEDAKTELEINRAPLTVRAKKWTNQEKETPQSPQTSKDSHRLATKEVPKEPKRSLRPGISCQFRRLSRGGGVEMTD